MLEAGLGTAAVAHVVEVAEHVLACEALRQFLEKALHQHPERLWAQIHRIEQHHAHGAVALGIGSATLLYGGFDRFGRELVARAHVGEADQDHARRVRRLPLHARVVAAAVQLVRLDLGPQQRLAPSQNFEGGFCDAVRHRERRRHERRHDTFGQPHCNPPPCGA